MDYGYYISILVFALVSGLIAYFLDKRLKKKNGGN